MKKRVRIVSAVLSVAILLTNLFATTGLANAETVAAIKVNPDLKYQTFEGWGTSLAWFGDIIGGWSDLNRNKMADQLFSLNDGGLGFNIVRYNIGGGENPAHDHMRPGGEVPGFKDTEAGAYNWNADANQRWMLKAAQSRAGSEFISEAFSNSPPYWMTLSGCVSGNTDASKDNLKTDYYDDFAEYLTDVVKYYKDNYGVTFRTLDPVNEPNTNYWGANGRQEGCHFDVASQQKIIQAAYNSLSVKNLLPAGGQPGTSISAMDETSLDKCIVNLQGYDSATRDMISQVNTHVYSGSKRAELNSYVRSLGKKLWMSEIGVGGSVGHNHEAMNPAMSLASVVTKDLTTLGAEAWVYWQAVEDEANMLPDKENSNWGLIHADFDRVGENSYLTKQYYVMANYSRFIRPGYQLIESGNSNTVAAYDAASRKLVLVTYNNTNSAVNNKFDLSKFASTGTSAEVYRTSPTESLKQLSNITISDKTMYAGLAPNSVTTYVIPNVDLTSATEDANLLYYVDCGDATPTTLEAYDREIFGSYNSVEDQPFTADPSTGKNWGYSVDNTDKSYFTSDFNLKSLRSSEGGSAGKGIHYKFEVPNGNYTVSLGFLEPWSVTNRYQDIKIEGTGKDIKYTNSNAAGEIKVYKNIAVADGQLNIDILLNSATTQAPTISMIKVQVEQPETGIASITGTPSVAVMAGSSTPPVLPATIAVTNADGTTANVNVDWDTIESSQYAVPGAFSVNGTVSGTGITVVGRVMVLDPGADYKYYVDSTSGVSSSFNAIKAVKPGLLNSVPDMAYGLDSATNNTWGYTASGGGATESSDEYSSVRYDDANTVGKGINYSFSLPNGVYDVELGFKEIWTSTRNTDIKIQGKTKATAYVPPAADDLKKFANISVQDGKLSIDIVRSASNTNASADPVVSWISITGHRNNAPAINETDKKVYEGEALSFKLNATDIDEETLTYSATDLPTGAVLDSATGQFSWTPGNTQAGVYTVKFKVTDPNSASASQDVVITVEDVPVPNSPTGLKIDSTYAKSSNLSWDAINFPVEFRLYRSAIESGTYDLIYSGTGTSYFDRGLESSTQYFYKIKAVSTEGESPLSAAVNTTTTAGQADTYTLEQLKNNDYIVYFVNAGDATPATAESGDKLGLYSSKTEQAYGADTVSGKKWGYDTSAASGTSVTTATDKLGSVRYFSGTQSTNEAVKYKFEITEGLYEVTVGIQNPWSARDVKVLYENNDVSGIKSIGSYSANPLIVTSKVYVTDGELNVDVAGANNTSLSNYNDPMVSYITVKKCVTIPISDLKDRITTAETEAAKTDIYSKFSIDSLNKAISDAKAFVKNFEDNSLNINDDSVQDIVNMHMNALSSGLTALAPKVVYTAITPGATLLDTNGAVLDAHGAGIMYDEVTQKYYWYGEYHSGTWPGQGVRCYSSTDLLNWTDEGMALTTIKSKDQFTSDPLISSIYAGRTDTDNIWADIRLGRIIERPKVIYNDKTKKYVMWAHIDGDKDPDNDAQNYGKAQAGVAISDSPTGPFVYLKSYRMDQCPPDQTDSFPSDKGMARDMNVFKDTDGTAYLIYSSEENLTIYISRLTPDYLDITGWHKDTKEADGMPLKDANGVPVRDTSYKSVYGTDFVRVYPGTQREAPAIFKYDGKYYLLTSGATGWSANQNKYSVADSIFGPWSTPVNPFVRTLPTDPDPANAFNTQTTCVIPVDPANGKFIYVGDRWNGGNFANSGAKYVLLPIEFGQGTDMMIKWYDSWETSKLDSMAKITVNTKFPETATLGTVPALPSTVDVICQGVQKASAVTWTVNSNPLTTAEFSAPGLVMVKGVLTDCNNREILVKIYVLPDKAIYFVNAGGHFTEDYSLLTSYMQNTLLNRGVADQAYNSADTNPWGYDGATGTNGGSTGDIFTTIRYCDGGNKAGNKLNYNFKVNNGTYDVYLGLYDPWSNTTRKADVYFEGIKQNNVAYVPSSTQGYTGIPVTDGTLNLTLQSTAAQDPMVSWIMIVDNSLTPSDPTMGLKAAVSGESAQLSWNRTLGSYGYKLLKSDAVDGAYTEIYSGNSASFTDNGLTPDKNYYYKVYTIDQDGNKSAESLPITVAVLAAPAGLKVQSVIGPDIQLAWDAVTAAVDGYKLYSSDTENGTYSLIYTGTDTTYTHTGLGSGTTKYYKVSSYNASGQSALSAPVMGVTEATAQDIALKITEKVITVPNPAVNETSVTLPSVPAGFTVAIKSSDNPIVTTDGAITLPSQDTEVGLVFEVTRLTDGTKAETGIVTITVPRQADSAQAVADSITAVQQPKPGDTSIKMPVVPAGYDIRIFWSDSETVITTDGAISVPGVETTVKLVFEVTKLADNSKALTAQIPVVIGTEPTAMYVANLIKSIPNPTVYDSKVTFPTVPAGFSIAIKSSDSFAISNEGYISLPDTATYVTLVFEVTKTSDGSKADTAPIKVFVPARPTDNSSGSGAGSSQGTSTTTTQTPSPTPKVVVKDGVITVDKTQVDTTGATNILKMNASDLAKAIETSKETEDGIKTVVVTIPQQSNSKGYSVVLPVEILAAEKVNASISIVTQMGTVVVQNNMLDNMDTSAVKTVELVIEKVDNKLLDIKTQEQIGNKPVVDLSLKVDGKVVSWKNTNAPVRVAIPYNPTEKELANKEHLTVNYIDDNGRVESVPDARYDEVNKLVTFTTTHFSKYAIVFLQKSFNDLSKARWATNAIEVMASKGIVDGRTEDEFDPDKNITRGEFVKWLVRTLNLKADFDNNFDDVKVTDSCYNEMGIAKALGITAGIGNNKSGADMEITRQDMMVMTAQVIKLAKKDWLVTNSGTLARFIDNTKIAGYAKNSVSELVASGIIIGSDDKINPKGKTTRAEAAAMLYTIYNK